MYASEIKFSIDSATDLVISLAFVMIIIIINVVDRQQRRHRISESQLHVAFVSIIVFNKLYTRILTGKLYVGDLN